MNRFEKFTRVAIVGLLAACDPVANEGKRLMSAKEMYAMSRCSATRVLPAQTGRFTDNNEALVCPDDESFDVALQFSRKAVVLLSKKESK